MTPDPQPPAGLAASPGQGELVKLESRGPFTPEHEPEPEPPPE